MEKGDFRSVLRIKGHQALNSKSGFPQRKGVSVVKGITGVSIVLPFGISAQQIAPRLRCCAGKSAVLEMSCSRMKTLRVCFQSSISRKRRSLPQAIDGSNVRS